MRRIDPMCQRCHQTRWELISNAWSKREVSDENEESSDFLHGGWRSASDTHTEPDADSDSYAGPESDSDTDSDT